MTDTSNNYKPDSPHTIHFKTDPLRLMAPSSVAGKHFLEVVQPPTVSYVELVNELVAIANDKSEDPLVDYTDALIAVVDYLQKDPATVNCGALNPLLKTLAILQDTLAGSRPELLFRTRALEGGGRPTDTQEQRINAFLALAFSLMREANISDKEAVKKLIQSVNKHGLINLRTKEVYTVQDLVALKRKISTKYGPVKLHEHHQKLLKVFDLMLTDPRGSVLYSLRMADYIVEASAKHVPDT